MTDIIQTAYIFTNSPGELSRWVSPICNSLATQFPNCRITILLTPCPYATGNEASVAMNLPGVHTVFLPKQTIHKLFSFKEVDTRGIVICLGGDPLYARLFSTRYSLDSFLYSEQKVGWRFSKVFLREDGDLMSHLALDSPKKTSPSLENSERCLFLPSSRPKQFEALVPLYHEALRYIHSKTPGFQVTLLVSPFISKSLLSQLEKKGLLTHFKVSHNTSSEEFQTHKMIVTIPGTNTSEAMYLNTPILLIVPTNHPSLFILHGLLGILTRLPVIGFFLRGLLIYLLEKKAPPLSLPNILSKTRTVPEYIQKFSPESLGKLILKHFNDSENHAAQQELFSSMCPKDNVSDRIVSEIANYLKQKT